MQQSIAGTVNGAAINHPAAFCVEGLSPIHRVWKAANSAAAISAHASTRPRAHQQQTEES